MRFPAAKSQENKIGDSRTVRKFLFLPKKLGDEWRWFEFAMIRQVWNSRWCQPPESRGWICEDWIDVSFENG